MLRSELVECFLDDLNACRTKRLQVGQDLLQCVAELAEILHIHAA